MVMKTVIICLVGIALLTGCRSTEYVPVETVKTEYKDRVREVHDTTMVQDTRLIYVKGDTVLDIRYRDRTRNVYLHDTLWYVCTDSVQVPYPVEKELTKWEQFKVDYSTYIILALTFGLVIVIWLVRKRGG